jgi:hypothetical protein
MYMKLPVLLLLAARSGSYLTAAADTNKAPPAFFVQDPTDSLCLAGEEFKRCSIETLFYVLGEPGRQMWRLSCFDETMGLSSHSQLHLSNP